MHIPDGFIDGKTAVVSGGLSLIGLGWALRRVKRELPPRRVPLLGLSAAFLFAAQMVNFPVLGGTSGHLIGGALVAALLGPSAGILVVTTVLIVQCFLFADGGVMALGANIFNMGILGAGGGYLVYSVAAARMPGVRGRVSAVAFAGWCSTVIASMSCAGELAWSGTVPWTPAFTAMTTVHMVIGLGEGLISALVLLAIERTRPELVAGVRDGRALARRGELLRYGLLISLGIAIFVAPFACPWPDGLESVASKLGFEHRQSEMLPGMVPGYQWPGVHWAVGATALAGASGTVLVFGLAWLLGRVLVPGKEPAA